MKRFNFINIFLFLILLSSFAAAKEFVYLKKNGEKAGPTTTLTLDVGQPYTFYGFGSSGIDYIILSIKGEGLGDEGKTALISFTPFETKTYELLIIGLQKENVVASQRFYLNVEGLPSIEKPIIEESKEEIVEKLPCQEKWDCEPWTDCIDNFHRRVCQDANKCGTVFNKPLTEVSCAEEPICPAQDIIEQKPGERPKCVKKTQQKVTETKEAIKKEVKEKKEKCLPPNKNDFLSICNSIECEKKSHVFSAGEGKLLKIGFVDMDGRPNPNLYNTDLSQTDTLFLFNKRNKKVYVFYGNEVERAPIAKIVKPLEEQFYNHPCSAFYHLVTSLGVSDFKENIKIYNGCPEVELVDIPKHITCDKKAYNCKVHKDLKKPLIHVAALIKKENPEYELIITGAFRTLEQQKIEYDKAVKEMKDKKLKEPRACKPSCDCPHVSGKAIDIAIKNWDLGKHNPYDPENKFWEHELANQKRLREILKDAGFVGFQDDQQTQGEWWHFECCNSDRYARAKKAGVDWIV